MAGEWIETVLQEIAANKDRAFAMGPFGSNIKSENYRESGVPVIRGTNLAEPGGVPFIADDFAFLDEEKADSLASSNCSPNDIVFVAQGTVGKVGIVPSDSPYRRFVLSQNLMKVTVNLERADPRFVFYFYRSDAGQHEIMSRVNPTGVPCISKPLTSLRRFGIRMPSDVNEQRAIAHILGTLDDKIELNRRMNETLEAIARAIFKSWFVDFDPVRAKAEGRDTCLPREIADLFPDSFQGSPLGKIPKGWGTQLANALLNLDKGLSYKGEFLGDSGVPMVNLGCFLGQGRFNELAFKHYTGEFHLRHTVKAGDLLVANTDITQKREVLGSPGIVPPTEDSDALLFTHHVFALRFNEGKELWKLFVYFILLGEEFRKRACGFATGTTVLALPREAILDLSLPAPPKEVIDAFNAATLPLLQRQWANAKESRTLAALRDALLPKLISGELRVRDAEPVAEDRI